VDKRRVLLLCASLEGTHPQLLLGEALENVLSKVEDVELVGTWTLDDQALARLAQGLPDILLIAEEEAGEQATSLTAQVLERYPDLPVVRVGLMQNVVRLYTSRTLPARSADLIEAIRSLPVHQRKSETKG
jgi:DNA-binding NarL/FixJ family response regulator